MSLVNFRRCVVIVLVCLLVGPQASAATQKCAGKKATKVGTQGNDKINGTKGNDVIVALGGFDEIYGKGGNDLICAGGSGDYVNGGGGKDTLMGQGGDDYMEGEEGDDLYKGGPGTDGAAWENAHGPITASFATNKATGAGNDSMTGMEQLFGSPFDDTFIGGPGDDELYPLAGNDSISAGAGDDYFEGAAGNDTIDGGPGEFDFASFSPAPGPMTIDLSAQTATGDGNDTVTRAEIISATHNNDTLIGDDERNIIYGLDGDDTIDGGGEFDAIAYEASPGPVTANIATGTASGEGDDTFSDIEALFGSESDDVFTGSDESDDLVGHGGNDQLYGAGGEDYIEGNAGDDLIDGGPGIYDSVGHGDSFSAVNIDLAAGGSTGEGTDTYTGIELAIGSRFDDTLKGDDGDNLFYGLDGNDAIDGRGGSDTMLYESADRGVTASLVTGKASGEGNDTFENLEGLVGSFFDDTLTGDGGDNLLISYDGDDVLNGGGGNDYFEAGFGNDVVDGGGGSSDMIDYFFSEDAVEVDLAAGTAEGEGSDELTSIEEVLGSLFDDTILGSAVGNYIFGDLGDDTIDGRDGDDGLDGFDGSDNITGGAGFDECFAAEIASACEAGDQPEGNALGGSGRSTSDLGKRNNQKRHTG